MYVTSVDSPEVPSEESGVKFWVILLVLVLLLFLVAVLSSEMRTQMVKRNRRREADAVLQCEENKDGIRTK